MGERGWSKRGKMVCCVCAIDWKEAVRQAFDGGMLRAVMIRDEKHQHS